MERFKFIFVVAGLGFFIFSMALSAYLPAATVVHFKEQSAEDLSKNPPIDILLLKEQYPAAYIKAYFSELKDAKIKNVKDIAQLLCGKYPKVVTALFDKTIAQRLAWVKANDSKAYAAAFKDKSDEEALELMSDDFESEEYIDLLNEATADIWEASTKVSVEEALALLNADLPHMLLKVRLADPSAYDEIFSDRTDTDVMAQALRQGHQIYIGNACWHCHSQQVRPWGNDIARYGQPSYPEEYHNELNRPPLWGTRRIGPDLVRNGGKQSNDWHVAHFYRPKDVSPYSIMPNYPWLLEKDGKTPNKKGLAIITYIQWLGSWQNSKQENIYNLNNIQRENPKPQAVAPIKEKKKESQADEQEEE